LRYKAWLFITNFGHIRLPNIVPLYFRHTFDTFIITIEGKWISRRDMTISLTRTNLTKIYFDNIFLLTQTEQEHLIQLVTYSFSKRLHDFVIKVFIFLNKLDIATFFF